MLRTSPSARSQYRSSASSRSGLNSFQSDSLIARTVRLNRSEREFGGRTAPDCAAGAGRTNRIRRLSHDLEILQRIREVLLDQLQNGALQSRILHGIERFRNPGFVD